MEAPRLVRTIYAVRTGAFAYCFLALGLLLWERGAPAPAWGFLAAQFLVYPHLLYLRALKSKRPRQAEFDNLFVDSTLFGAWCAYFGFEPVVTLGLVAGSHAQRHGEPRHLRRAAVAGIQPRRRARFGRRGRLQLRAGRERSRERGARLRHPRVHLRGGLRGLPPEPAPRLHARQAEGERGALPAASPRTPPT